MKLVHMLIYTLNYTLCLKGKPVYVLSGLFIMLIHFALSTVPGRQATTTLHSHCLYNFFLLLCKGAQLTFNECRMGLSSMCIRAGLLLRGRCRMVVEGVSLERRFCAVASSSVLRTCRESFGAESQNVNEKLTWQPNKIVVQCRYKNGNGKLPVEVNVFDNELGHDTPTVVMLLGLVGTGDDFRPMVTYLSSAGIRCVAPEIPGTCIRLCTA